MFAAAGVAVLLTSHAAQKGSATVPAVSRSCDPGVNAAEYWLMNDSEYHALQTQVQPALQAAVKNANLFYSVGGGSAGLSPVTGSQTLATYASYAQFSSDVTRTAVNPGIHWIMYDNENWPQTPRNEQQQPLLYEQKFADLAHAHGYKVMLAPAQNLLPGFSSVAYQDGTSYAQAYVTYFTPTTARYADAWDIQAQPYEAANFRASNAYANLVETAAAAARAVNPKLVVFTGLSAGLTTSAAELYQDWNSARSAVAGFWLAPQSGSVALTGQFLNLLPTYVGPPGKTCAGTQTATGANGTGLGAAHPYWVIDDHAISLLQTVGASSALLSEAFNNDKTYAINPVPNTSSVPQAMQTATFTSYQSISAAFANGTLPGAYNAVIYDNEDWNLTPLIEQQDPGAYERLAANLLHAHGLRYIASPAPDIVKATGMLEHGSVYDTYISRNLAGAAAKYADEVDIQAQGSEADLSRYASFVAQAAQQARQANPKVVVLAGLSTDPNGVPVSGNQLENAYAAVNGIVDGYWLSIPGQSAACPDCDSPQPQAADDLLQQLYQAK
jgi:hypothetical protein